MNVKDDLCIDIFLRPMQLSEGLQACVVRVGLSTFNIGMLQVDNILDRQYSAVEGYYSE